MPWVHRSQGRFSNIVIPPPLTVSEIWSYSERSLTEPIEVQQPDAEKLQATVEQLDAKQLNVSVDNFPPQDHFQNLPHYVALPHNTPTVVWTPSLGQKIHLVSFIASTPAAGIIFFYRRTPPAADVAFMRLDFNLRQTVPFGLNTDLDFDWDQQLVATFIADAAAPTAYITAIGHEHNPESWPL